MQRRLGRTIALAATLAATGAAMLGAAAPASAAPICQLGHCVDVAAGTTGAGVTVDGNTSYLATCEAGCGGRPYVVVSLVNGTVVVRAQQAPTLTYAHVAAAGHTITLYRAFGGWIGATVDGQNVGPVRVCPPVCN
jgi:hypothetical protein